MKERMGGEPGETPVTRRDLLKGASAVGAAALSPAFGGCSSKDDPPPDPPGPETLFQHGVASGDPLPEAVIIWTRVTPEGTAPVSVAWEVATDANFTTPVTSGTFETNADRDFTVKVDVTGLTPLTSYYYRFTAQQRMSAVGRARTAPTGPVERLRFGVVSCASFGHGYFHAYSAVAARNDLDAVIHLGDYIYEYESLRYGEVREYDTPHEILTLADYRGRHAQYKRDPDLQAIHRQHVFIVIWDDHEIADNAYKDGAVNHDSATEGDWGVRKAAAVQAYFEWMPIREATDQRVFRTLAFGDLADLILLDTRHWGRTVQPGEIAGPPPAPDPTRTLLGEEQATWFEDQLRTSTAKWKLVGQQVMIGNLIIQPGVLLGNLDQWHGYPESRKRLIDFLRSTSAKDVVVLTGDIHSSWAIELVNDPNDAAEYDPATGRGSVAVEFVTPGITSPGFGPNELALIESSRQFNPHIRYIEPTLRGYLILDVTADRTQGEWHHFDDITQQTPGNESLASVWSVQAGSTRLVEQAQAALDHPNAPDPAP